MSTKTQKSATTLAIAVFMFALQGSARAELEIPKPEDWIDRGVIVTEGGSGAWDARFFPDVDSPATAIFTGTGISLFYIAADGDRVSDGGPSRRALGVASSADGREFEKYPGNPVATYLPTPTGCNGEEEGIWRASAALHGGSETVIYYGGARQTSCRGDVQSDILLMTSSDGRSFVDRGIVLAATDRPAWGTGGRGGEVTPAAAYEYNGQWRLFYISKEVEPQWSLGLASGPARDRFDRTQPLLMANETSLGEGAIIRSGSIAVLDPDTYVLFLQLSNFRLGKSRIEARTFDPRDPANLGEPTTVFDWDMIDSNSVPSFVALDEATQSWYLYYVRSGEGISLKTASVSGSSSEVGRDLVVDFSDPGYREFGEGDDWQDSAAVDHFGSSKARYAKNNGSSASWEAPVAGQRDVYAWWPRRSATGTLFDRDAQAEYRIYDGSLLLGTVVRDQNSDFGQWVPLGSFTFASGSARVELVRTSVSGDDETVSDAVRFVDPALADGTGSGLISNVLPAAYEVDDLLEGSDVYIDGAVSWSEPQAPYAGAEFIRTALEDRGVDASTFLSFHLAEPSTVYVAYDDSATALPSWLIDGSWTLTGDFLDTSASDGPALRVYKQLFGEGQVHLGGNSQGSLQDVGQMYSVIAVPGVGTGPVIEQAGQVVIEAEDPDYYDPRTDPAGLEWHVSSSIPDAVGKHVQTTGESIPNATWENGCELGYLVDFSTPGPYNVWVRRYSFDARRNSVFAGIDGEQTPSIDNCSCDFGQWAWVNLGTITVNEPATRAFQLRRREAGFRIDRILLTQSANIPEGYGPPMSPRRNIQEAWVEDFELPDGTDFDGKGTAWSVDTSRLRGTYSFAVSNNRFLASNTRREAVWRSEVIDIALAGPVAITLDWKGVGSLDAAGTLADYVTAYYRVDDAPEVRFAGHVGRFANETATVEGIEGTTVQVVIRTRTSGPDETYSWDNVSVIPRPIPQQTLP